MYFQHGDKKTVPRDEMGWMKSQNLTIHRQSDPIVIGNNMTLKISAFSRVLSLTACFLCVTVASAQEKTKSSINAADLTALQQQVKGVKRAHDLYQQAGNSGDSEKYWQAYMQTNDALIPKILETVRRAPNAMAAFELLEWVVTNGRISVRTLRTNGYEATELLRDHHVQKTNISRLCWEFAMNVTKPAKAFLEAAAEKNPDRTARAHALFALAHLTKDNAMSEAFEEATRSLTNTAPPVNWTAGFQEAITMYKRVLNDYGGAPNFPSGPGIRNPLPTLGKQAELELYECHNLRPGVVAPEVIGEDLRGKKIKLSDYRGKLVVLSFWASWCGPCMQMVPHERSLLERMKGKKFAIVGVNGDSDRSAAKKAAEQNQMAWESFWSRGSEEGIAAQWNVHGWPTVFVLDANGVIRLKFGGYGGKWTDEMLDKVVDRLMQEL